jgi:sugar lactone lactonase YvrE
MFPTRLNFYVRYSIVAGAIVLLGACGGGGDGGGASFLPIIPPAQSPPETQLPADVNYAVGGTISGLVGTLVLQNNAGDDLTIKADGAFSFAAPINKGGAYDIRVRTQPFWQFCTVSQGNGSVTAEVKDVVVVCSAAAAQVSTLAGSGVSISSDGKGAAAAFGNPVGIVVEKSDTLLVSEQSNRVRKVTADGNVTTFAGSGANASVDGNGTTASFTGLLGVALDASGNAYVAEGAGGRIRMITPTADVSTVAGSGVPGSADGIGTAAQFLAPDALAIDSAGNIYVAETTGCVIRKITQPGNNVTTLAGTSGTCAFADGQGAAASFNGPSGIAVDAADNLFVADAGNARIRMITPTGVVTTFAGSAATGTTDGTGSAASFVFPSGVAFDVEGNLYVVDAIAHLLRRITPAGAVSTLAGQANVGGAQDGIGAAATFNQPVGVAVGADGTIYVTDHMGNRIRKVTPVQAP